MKFYKLRVARNAASIASAFNESFEEPGVLRDGADVGRIDWIREANEDVLVGEKVWYLLPFPPFLLLPF